MQAKKRLSGKQLEDVLAGVTRGDIAACHALAADTLKYCATDRDIALQRRDLIFSSEKTGVAEVLGLLCAISACVGDFKFCDFWMDDIEKGGEPYFGYLIYTTIKNDPKLHEKSIGYLRRSARAGYLLAKKEECRLVFRRFGVFGSIPVAIHALYLAAVGAVMFARNSRDPRLPRLPK